MKKNHVFGHYGSNVWRKTFRVMKLTVLLFLMGILSVAAEGFAQGGTISLRMENASLEDVLQELKSHSDYTFVYSDQHIEDVKLSSFEVENANLEVVMEECLKGTGLDYYVENDVVVIFEKDPVIEKPVQQEKKTIKGGVKDKQGLPLPGVSVVIKGTLIGTVTDNNGSYSIEVDNENAVLVFSFVGMEPQEIRVGGQTHINVRLKDTASELGEVIVTGYQEVKKERITGSVEVISVEDIADKSYASVDQLLAGKVSGMTSFMSSGQTGNAADINIRGINTISGSTQPLWIVDGLPLQGESPNMSGGGFGLEADVLNNGIGNIPASDIKSITVLKDAAAAAIYGARAANGVIVVTTKAGSEGDIYANFDVSMSFQEAPKLDIDFMNSAEKIELEKALFEDYGSEKGRTSGGTAYRIMYDINDGRISQDEGNRLLNELSQTNTDWFDVIFRNSVSKNYGANISGGSKKVTCYFSVNRSEQDGILRSDSYDNTSVRAKGTFKPNDKFDVIFGVNTNTRNKNYHNSKVNPLEYAVFANPYEKPYNDDGTYAYDETFLNIANKSGQEVPLYGTFNMLSELNNTKRKSKYTSTSTYVNLRYNIIDELKFSSKFVRTNTQRDNHNYANPGTYSSYQRSFYKSLAEGDFDETKYNLGFYEESASFTEEYSFNNTLEYTKEFDNKIYVSALIGQEISATKSNDFNTFLPEYYPLYDLAGYPNIEGADASRIALTMFGGKGFRENRYSSFLSSFRVGYADKYILNFNARYDGADIIGDAERFAPLWSASARWNVHKEDFFQNVSFMNELYLKGEYGYTGNINRGVYPFTIITVSEYGRYQDELIASNFSYPNPSVKWEEKEEKSFGVGASMFNYRFNFNFNYYHNYVSDVLNNKRLPSSAGVTSLTANVSNLLNEGYELSCNFVPVKTKDFLLTLNFNGAYNKNEVSNAYYSNLDEVKLKNLNNQVSGYAVNTVFGAIDKGVNPATGRRMVELRRPQENGGYALETIRRWTVNDENDRAVKLGQLNPKYSGGFGLSARYKNWNLNTTFTFEAGHIIPKFAERLSSPAGSRPFDYSKLNVLKKRIHYWRQPGDVTNVESYTDATKLNLPLDTDYEKGDYMKMKSLILSYKLPADVLKKANIGIKRLRMSVQADNLFTLTGYSGIDPETRNSFGYPVSRTYRFALNFGF